MEQLRLSIVQTDIIWENKQENLRRLRTKLQQLSGTTEIVVLPEMFSTGFSMNSQDLAEPINGFTIQTLKQWATEFELALCGSFICSETDPYKKEQYYNRAFFLTPEGEAYYYDKRHLFRMGHEAEHFSEGNQKLIVTYRGWNIRPLICYDLRFPVWSRNVNNECDLLIYVANWPQSRRLVWDTLLRARALENQCYVCGVNRIGTDGNHWVYNGGSAVYSAKGETVASVSNQEEGTACAIVQLAELKLFREKFPVWRDADVFNLE